MVYTENLTEHLRVQAQRTRARLLGVTASLTLEQWEQTIADFNGLCAYCLKEQFDVLEHFVPIAVAGTTVKNCIPACYACNQKKRDHTGQELYLLFGQKTIERVQQYLIKRSTKLPDHPIKHQRQVELLPDKLVYSAQELLDHLPCRLAPFSRLADMSESTVKEICKGRSARPDTADRLLQAFSKVYNRPLSLDNVTGISLYKKVGKRG